MAKVSIPVEKLKKFTELVSCEGKLQDGTSTGYVINEFVITAFESTIESAAVDKVGKIYANVKMSATVLEPGNIVIGNLDMFEKCLSSFEQRDTIILSQGEGILTIQRDSPKKVAKFHTVDLDNIETYKTSQMIKEMWKEEGDTLSTSKGTKLDNVVVAKAEDFQQLVVDTKIVGEQFYPFSILKDENGQLTLKVEIGSLESGLVVIKAVIPAVIKSVELKNKYGYGFENIFMALKGDVKLYTAQNKPLWITKNESDYSVKYMITPVVI